MQAYCTFLAHGISPKTLTGAMAWERLAPLPSSVCRRSVRCLTDEIARDALAIHLSTAYGNRWSGLSGARGAGGAYGRREQGQSLLCFGGEDGAGGVYNEMWEYRGSGVRTGCQRSTGMLTIARRADVWTLVEQKGDVPAPREGHCAAVVDHVRRQQRRSIASPTSPVC